MSWFSENITDPVVEHVVPAAAKYGGAVLGGAVGTVVGGPAGTVLGAAAGRAASDAIQSAASGKRGKMSADLLPGLVGGALGGPAGSFAGVAIGRAATAMQKNRRSKRGNRMTKNFRSDTGRVVPAMVVRPGAVKGDALATAGRLIASLQSADPRMRSYAKAVLNATARRARAGDDSARRAVSVLKTAQSVNKSPSRLTGFLVTNSGRVVIGSFLQTG